MAFFRSVTVPRNGFGLLTSKRRAVPADFDPAEIATVFKHLLTLPQVTLEDRDAVEQAITSFEQGLDFADALHHASYRDCEAMASFDDRKFARRAKRLGLAPRVIVPQ